MFKILKDKRVITAIGVIVGTIAATKLGWIDAEMITGLFEAIGDAAQEAPEIPAGE